MLQLRNETDLPAALFALPDPDGVEALHLVVQRTFALTPGGPTHRDQRPIDRVDALGGEGPAAWLRRPGVVHVAKAFTEVLLEAEAVAPGGSAVTALDVGLQVGPLRRALRVVGDRYFTGLRAPLATEPEPFLRVPLTPHRAFGGAGDARNPLGVGWWPTDRDIAGRRGQRLPNVEDPAAMLRAPGDAPTPALVTPLPPSWHPRAGYAGTYDEAWAQRRAPFLPVDFDRRFAQVAAPAQWVSPGLYGGEPITLVHVADAPRIESRVPAQGLAAEAWWAGRAVPLPMRLETLHLFPAEGVGTVVYRAMLRCGPRLLDVAAVTVTPTDAA